MTDRRADWQRIRTDAEAFGVVVALCEGAELRFAQRFTPQRGSHVVYTLHRDEQPPAVVPLHVVRRLKEQRVIVRGGDGLAVLNAPRTEVYA